MQGLIQDLMVMAPDLCAWLLMPVSFAIVLLSPTVRRDEKILLACWFTIALHHCVSIVHTYFFLVPGGEGDAARFHAVAAAGEMEGRDYDANMYVQVLTELYRFYGRSLLLGCQVSVIGYTFGLLVFLQLCLWLRMRRPELLVLLYGVLPGALFHTSVPLREPWQMLVVMCTVWSITGILDKPRNPMPYVALVSCTLALSKLHNQLHLLAAVYSFIALAWTIRRNRALLVLMTLLALPVGYVMSSRTLASQTSTANMLLKRMETYRTGVQTTRAHYGSSLDASSPLRFMVTFPPVLFLYMFAPLPWQVSGLKDLYGLSESVIRMILVAGMLYNYRLQAQQDREKYGVIILFFLVTEAFWSIGSVNWGQAIRHRTVVWSLLVLSGLPVFLRERKPDVVAENEEPDLARSA